MKVEGISSSAFVPQKQLPQLKSHSLEGGNKGQVLSESLEPILEKKVSIGEQQLIEVIEHANKVLRGSSRSFKFSIHEETKEIMVKVIDNETQEVIREIPPEKILDMVAKMWELVGLFVDDKR